MKKILMVCFMVLVLFVTSGISATKYDWVKKDASWGENIALWDNIIGKNRMMVVYLSLLINEKDIIRIAKSGRYDTEKSKFLTENSRDFVKTIHIVIANQIREIGKSKEIKDSQYIYVTGVIKDPRAQAAKTGPEYEMEKEVFRGLPLYALWEHWRGPDTMNNVMDSLMTYLDKKK